MKRNNFCVFQTGFYYTGVCAQVCVHVCVCMLRSVQRVMVSTECEREEKEIIGAGNNHFES